MAPLHRLSAAEQTSAYLRSELGRGRWTETMPGVIRLAEELEVSRNSVEAALRQLQSEGLLVDQGRGRRRLISKAGGKSLRSMRVAILLSDEVDRQLDYLVELQHALAEAGHIALIPSKSLTELSRKLPRIRRLVNQTEADAWVIVGGEREVLEWFSSRPEPSFALFGRRGGLPLAATGPNKPPAYAEAARRLIDLGHRRIALLCRRLRRLPQPGAPERAFLDELKEHGLLTGDFNLPDWEETPKGLHKCLNSLFRVTPPTAILIDEAPLFIATLQYLAGMGISVPQNVSLICSDSDPGFDWCEPSIAHIRWDSRPVVRRIIRWAATVSRGGRDVRQNFVPAEFVPGGTIARAPAK